MHTVHVKENMSVCGTPMDKNGWAKDSGQKVNARQIENNNGQKSIMTDS